jgi:hypothetical protein
MDIDIDRVPFQCADKLPENDERKKDKHEIEPDKEKPKVLNPFEINCICSLLGQSKLSVFHQFGGK